jgi:hypothetical protein
MGSREAKKGVRMVFKPRSLILNSEKLLLDWRISSLSGG